jgi:peptidoglycan/LPS O-acetylase OafA/YrhL
MSVDRGNEGGIGALGQVGWSGAAPRIPQLDGLRGVAILLVLVHHFGESALADGAYAGLRPLFRSGWIGVDLFFVLSGYLITGILLRRQGERGALRRFYARRVLRIWPLYLAACLTLLVLLPSSGLITADERHWLGVFAPWYWLHLTNVPAAWGIDLPLHTTHFWSLAVEEQFYLCWPLLVFALPRAVLPVTTLVLMLGSTISILMALTVGWTPWLSAAWYVLPLGAGGWIAQRQASGGVGHLAARARRLLVLLVVIGAAASAARLSLGPVDGFLGPGTRPLVGLAWACVLVHLLSVPDGRFSKWCQPGWLMRLGLISYGVYVLHNPLRALAPRLGLPVDQLLGGGLPGRVTYIALMSLLAYALAELSWAALERPFLRLKDRIGSPRRAPGSHSSGLAGPTRG